MTHEELFSKLLTTNVNDMTEVKNGLTYLSWANAWAEFKKSCPDATYEIDTYYDDINHKMLPYMYDEKLGYMVTTKVTANELTHQMWLPVMDGANKAMLDHPYEYSTKFGKKTVDAATMFDVNKTIMRCLTKNLAMFGLGLYIYAGEDLPYVDDNEEKCTAEQVVRMKELQVKEDGIKAKFKVDGLEGLTKSQAEFVIKTKENANK